MNETGKSLKIAIATIGRFHVLDLARELDALGHQVHFYSCVPKRRAAKFGLPPRCHIALLPFLAPLLALSHFFRRTRFSSSVERLVYVAVDELVARRLKACDVVIGMSGIYVKALKAARENYGAKVVLERGSTHIDIQKQILDELQKLDPTAVSVPASLVQRERTGYLLADRIAIASLHVEASFIDQGVPARKLFRNVYGTDLTMFTPNPAVERDPFLLLFVGGWSYQKGVDVLCAAMAQLSRDGFRLFHVGGIGDAPIPNADWFHSVGTVDQRELPDWYQRGRCLVLPSRQEGLALVQVQALACGCPVVGSSMSGAADLQEMVPAAGMVQVVAVGDEVGLIEAVRQVPPYVSMDASARDELRASLSWGAYARRYESMLCEIAREGAA